MGVSPSQKTRLTAAGNIKTSAGELKCVIVTNTGASAGEAKFNDDTSGTGTDVFEVYVPTKDSRVLLFPAGVLFSTGIRVGTLDSNMVVTGVYV